MTDETDCPDLDELVEEEDAILPIAPKRDPDRPAMTDPRWVDFVLGQFDPETELADGQPTTDGLRRVAELLLGPIVRGAARVVQSPTPQNNFHAVAEYTIVIQPHDGGYELQYTDAADVYEGNTDAAFRRFAVATACTRAEGRALRKALKLRRVVAAEEVCLVPHEESGVNGKITPTQLTTINELCRRNNISAARLLAKSRKFKYQPGKTRPEEIPYPVAAELLSYLTQMQRDQTSITDDIKGYDPTWRD